MDPDQDPGVSKTSCPDPNIGSGLRDLNTVNTLSFMVHSPDNIPLLIIFQDKASCLPVHVLSPPEGTIMRFSFLFCSLPFFNKYPFRTICILSRSQKPDPLSMVRKRIMIWIRIRLKIYGKNMFFLFFILYFQFSQQTFPHLS